MIGMKNTVYQTRQIREPQVGQWQSLAAADQKASCTGA